MARVVFPASLRHIVGGATELDVPARSTRALLVELERRFPGFARATEKGTALALDGGVVPLDKLEDLEPDTEVCFVPQIGGG